MQELRRTGEPAEMSKTGYLQLLQNGLCMLGVRVLPQAQRKCYGSTDRSMTYLFLKLWSATLSIAQIAWYMNLADGRVQ